MRSGVPLNRPQSALLNAASETTAAAVHIRAAGCTERFSAVGDEGQLWSDGTTLWVRKRGGETEEHVFDAVETIPAEVGDFADRIAAGQAPIHNHLDGINVLKVILGAYKSAADATIVTLADL